MTVGKKNSTIMDEEITEEVKELMEAHDLDQDDAEKVHDINIIEYEGNDSWIAKAITNA